MIRAPFIDTSAIVDGVEPSSTEGIEELLNWQASVPKVVRLCATARR
jgi:hypothetical protein